MKNIVAVNIELEKLRCLLNLKQTAIQFQDEGVYLGDKCIDTINFTGEGITATRYKNILTVNVPGSTGGGIDSVEWGDITGTLSNQTDLQNALNQKVNLSRQLTINGVTFDLSADRSWTISATNIYNTSDSLTGNRSLTLAGSTLDFVGSSITTRIFSSGRIGINTTTDLGKALDIMFGDVSITTSDTNANTIGFTVQNSVGTILIRGFNNGFVSIPQLETPTVTAVSSLLTLRSFLQGSSSETAVRSIFASPPFSTLSTYVNFKTDQTFFVGSGTLFYTGFEANDGGFGAGGTLDITGFFFNPKVESGTGTWIYTAFKNNIGDNKFNATSGTTKFGGGSAATSLVDINATNGYAQLRLRTAYTPSATADTNGNTGDYSWDDSYMYVKTSAGWKRSALSTF